MFISLVAINGVGQLLLALIVAHLLLDYPLQGDFLAKAKNHRNGIVGVPWTQALAAHSMLQAAGVWIITGSLVLGLGEFIAHCWIDYLKSDGTFGSPKLNGQAERAFHIDQGLHVACKLLWILMLPFVQ